MKAALSGVCSNISFVPSSFVELPFHSWSFQFQGWHDLTSMVDFQPLLSKHTLLHHTIPYHTIPWHTPIHHPPCLLNSRVKLQDLEANKIWRFFQASMLFYGWFYRWATQASSKSPTWHVLVLSETSPNSQNIDTSTATKNPPRLHFVTFDNFTVLFLEPW